MGTAPRQASCPSIPVSIPPSCPDTTLQEARVKKPTGIELMGALQQAAAAATESAESVFDGIAAAARFLSGAEGIALALETQGSIVCRARSGDLAPDLGAPMNTESGISGECLRSGSMLVCHDALADHRVDNQVCRSLGIRSVIAVPVRGEVGVAGILEAFSSRPDAFDGEALRALRALGETAGTAYRRHAPMPTSAVPAVRVCPPKAISIPPLAPEEILGDSLPGKKHLWIVVTIAIALLATVVVAWWSWESPADETGPSMQTVQAATTEQPTAGVSRLFVPKPAPGLLRERTKPRVIVENAAETERMISGVGDSTEGSIRENALRRSSAASEVAAVEPPQVDLRGVAKTPDLAQLASVPTPMPSIGPRVSGGVSEAILIHRVEPVYPTQARMQRLSGKVTLSATIAADGSVREVAVLRGSSLLAAAAQDALRRWRYRPATLNGNPVEVQKEITFVFQP